jgi:DNA-binding PadR family transcriptional regulator
MNCFFCTDSNASITTQTNLYAQTVDSLSNVDCSVCGIYRITGTATALIKNNPEIVGKIRRWLWEQHHFHGVQRPQIDEYRLDTLKNQPNLTVGEMKDRFLQALYFLNESSQSIFPLDLLNKNSRITNPDNICKVTAALGASQDTSYFTLRDFLEFSKQQGFIDFESEPNIQGPKYFQWTLNGLEYAENSLKIRSNSQQIFIAMPFGHETEKDHFDRVCAAIKSSLESNGLTPYRIDNDHHIDRIDSKILNEIQNSRAVIVDLSHSNKTTKPPFGETGDDLKRAIPNANVYFEAGYAYALGKPVFYICNQNDFGNRAFDLATFNCLQYQETPEGLVNLQSELRDRLKEVLKIPNKS